MKGNKMVGISDQFINLMRKGRFMGLGDFSQKSIKLPKQVVDTAKIVSTALVTVPFIKKDDENNNIDIVMPVDNGRKYAIWSYDNDGNQKSFTGDRPLSIQELSARIKVNLDNKPQGNGILSLLEKYHFINWQDAEELLSNRIKSYCMAEEKNTPGSTVFVRLGKFNNRLTADVLTYSPAARNEKESINLYTESTQEFTTGNDIRKIEAFLERKERWFDNATPPGTLHLNPAPEEKEPEISIPETHKPETSSSESKTKDKIKETEERMSEISKKSEKSKNNGLTFADIGGQDAAIAKIKKTILYPIKYPEAFAKRKISHGVVLYGPPGTGKSLLAETLANESNAHFIKLNGLEMISKWVGQSEENLRKLFKEAQEKQPAIIFIDEFDGIASQRDNERDPHGSKVVNQILTLLSDIEKNGDNIFIVTATNRLDLLDSAVIRSGRMETHIELLPPQTEKDVLQILDIHSKNLPMDEDLNKPAIADILLKQKASGADIASIVNSANEQAFSRQNYSPEAKSIESIYDKMENGTFIMEDLENVKITNADFEAALREKYGKNIQILPVIKINSTPPSLTYNFANDNFDDVVID